MVFWGDWSRGRGRGVLEIRGARARRGRRGRRVAMGMCIVDVVEMFFGGVVTIV